MAIQTIMTSPVVTVELDDSLRIIKSIFEHTHFHHLLVIDHHELYGVISDRDLLKVLSPNLGTAAEKVSDTACLNKKAHQIMTREPITLMPNASIYDAIDLFSEHNISCIPIINEAKKPIGIVSWRDILKAIKLHRENKSFK